MDNLCQHIAWRPSSQLLHQGQICSSEHKEGQVLGYLCQLCAHGGTNFSHIEDIHGKQFIMGKAWLVMETLE
jgi:hypothetical protein